jgi:starvation-inducible DNA-binding protein
MFNTLHLMFEAQYTELALAVDVIAERIRALGYPAPGTYADFVKLSSIKEVTGVPTATKMIMGSTTSTSLTVPGQCRLIYPLKRASESRLLNLISGVRRWPSTVGIKP